MKGKPILYEMYILKGVAIIGLIVLHTYLPLINISTHHVLLKMIGPYAMPIFMFASGFLFGFSRQDITSLSDYIAFIKKKFRRLMIPYFTIWSIYIAIEFAIEFISGFTSLNYRVDRDFWKYILFYPSRGTALHLWFIYHLFFVFLIFPVLNNILRNTLVLSFFIFLLYIIPIPKFFYFNHVGFREVLLFFYLGYMYSRLKLGDTSLYPKYLCLIFLALSIILSSQREAIAHALDTLINPHIINKLLKLIILLSGVMFYYYLSILIKENRIPLFFNLLKYLGVYSASIYLFHHISIVAARIFLLNTLNPSKDLFPVVSIIIFISGIIFPILLTKFFIKRTMILPPLLLGVEKAPSF